jgi:hypothetical protein
VLGQINDTTGTASFCCREDLGKTVVLGKGKTVEVRLGKGKSVECTLAATWPRESDPNVSNTAVLLVQSKASAEGEAPAGVEEEGPPGRNRLQYARVQGTSALKRR